MVVVKELAAEFEVELAAELFDPLLDLPCLQLNVLLVIESLAHASLPSLVCNFDSIPEPVCAPTPGFPHPIPRTQ